MILRGIHTNCTMMKSIILEVEIQIAMRSQKNPFNLYIEEYLNYLNTIEDSAVVDDIQMLQVLELMLLV